MTCIFIEYYSPTLDTESFMLLLSNDCHCREAERKSGRERKEGRGGREIGRIRVNTGELKMFKIKKEKENWKKVILEVCWKTSATRNIRCSPITMLEKHAHC